MPFSSFSSSTGWCNRRNLTIPFRKGRGGQRAAHRLVIKEEYYTIEMVTKSYQQEMLKEEENSKWVIQLCYSLTLRSF
jgi:hypothetical protein